MAVRNQVVEATIGLLRRRGVAGAGIAAVLDSSGVARRSIYLNFPEGKSQLVAEATRVAGERVHARLLRDEPQPDELIETLIADWSAELSRTEFTAGCPIVAATLGHAVAAEANEAAGEAFTAWVDALAAAYVRTGRSETEARALAMTAISAVEGAILIAQATRSTEPLALVAEGLRAAR